MLRKGEGLHYKELDMLTFRSLGPSRPVLASYLNRFVVRLDELGYVYIDYGAKTLQLLEQAEGPVAVSSDGLSLAIASHNRLSVWTIPEEPSDVLLESAVTCQLIGGVASAVLLLEKVVVVGNIDGSVQFFVRNGDELTQFHPAVQALDGYVAAMYAHGDRLFVCSKSGKTVEIHMYDPERQVSLIRSHVREQLRGTLAHS